MEELEMDKFQDFKKWAEEQKAQKHLMSTIEGLQVQVYGNSPLQLNITVRGQQGACLKLEERRPGRFTIAMAPRAGASIDYPSRKEFSAAESLEVLRGAFPNENIGRIVDVLLRH